MSWRDRFELVLMAAIWGASFLFMRVAAPELGPLALIEIRVAIAALFLAVVLAWRGELGAVVQHAGPLTLLGTFNSAIPFSLYAYAALSLPAGYSSVLNATTPLFGAAVAWLFLAERLAPMRVLGLALGFSGVIVLVWSKLSAADDRLAVCGGLAAALCYGIFAHYTKRKLAHVAPLVISGGSLIGAALVLLPFALMNWPASTPSWKSLGCAAILGVLCTGIAYLIYFRLLARVGAVRAMTVTYLIPVFGVLWGTLFLDEPLTARALVGAAVILAGTVLVARGPKVAASAPLVPGQSRVQ